LVFGEIKTWLSPCLICLGAQQKAFHFVMVLIYLIFSGQAFDFLPTLLALRVG
jgi:hypothetical protein